MWRCLQLAQIGAGNVAPNPMVGAVLVHDGRIIGEGYHIRYGEAHAEVNCINSVAEQDKELIPKSTIYVSLEPCAHFGKTPPCCDLIIRNHIAKVVIGCRDNFEKVNGEGIRKMEVAGIEIIEGVLEKEAVELNRRFFTFHEKKRPYIILKWAQSYNLQIAKKDLSAVKISNEQTDKLVHRWRSEEAAIVVGYNTALHDDPALTNRLWQPGKDPVRVVLDKKLELPQSLKLFDGPSPLIVINKLKEATEATASFIKMQDNETPVGAMLRALYQRQLTSLIVEGGAKLLQAFIDAGLWDEARIITNETLEIEDGLPAPAFTNNGLVSEHHILSDNIRIYRNRGLSSPK
jgi:diaminohydroxyphosphoribosylaminopyrimidine deaminase / 5-amino-6-(5-phosphoribosylamino)uracil reductase